MEGEKGRVRDGLDSAASGGRSLRAAGTQTDSKIQGNGLRLSKINLFTLLSLWMELFPQRPLEEQEDSKEREGQNQYQRVGLVVVKDRKVVGLHYSLSELHAGQTAIIQHGARLHDCELFFSRRPCATCLKMIINAGVSQISFWPGDPEFSMLSQQTSHHRSHCISDDAVLDAMATEKLKSNSRPQICVLLQPLAPGLAQFIHETSSESDFIERLAEDDPELNTEEVFYRERQQHLQAFIGRFLVEIPQQHQDILAHMGLDNFCMEPYFSSLRHTMRELVEALAAIAASVPRHNCGFYRETSSPKLSRCDLSPQQDEVVSQDVARHCVIQARLLAYRTEDPKVGVGAVIWARDEAVGCQGWGSLCLVGCGYNAYPAGSLYAEYPQMDNKQGDRQRRKYRYIVHAEQNALTFRTRDIRRGEATMLFVTKCPCDECVPLIRGAGVTHIYTSDQDRGKDKGDISYLRFSHLRDVHKLTVSTMWQTAPFAGSSSSFDVPNGCAGKHTRMEQESCPTKRYCSAENKVSHTSGTYTET